VRLFDWFTNVIKVVYFSNCRGWLFEWILVNVCTQNPCYCQFNIPYLRQLNIKVASVIYKLNSSLMVEIKPFHFGSLLVTFKIRILKNGNGIGSKLINIQN